MDTMTETPQNDPQETAKVAPEVARVINMHVPRLTVSQRTRHTLNRLLKTPGYSKTALAAYCQKPASWLSAFLHPNPNRSGNPSFHLDELDDVASYFRISLGELLGAPQAGDLTGDESRLLLAFRELPPADQDRFLGLVEKVSLIPRSALQRSLPSRRKVGITGEPTQAEPTTGVEHGPPVPDAAVELARVHAAIHQALVILGTAVADPAFIELGTAAAGAPDDRSHAAANAAQAFGS